MFGTVLSPIVQKAGTPPSPPSVEDSTFDLDAVLPLDVIRQHTKTDDVPSVTDDLLRRYREAAFAAAEQYTGLLLMGKRAITQDISHKSDITAGARPRTHYTVRLRYPSADGVLYLYGGKQVLAVSTIKVEEGATKVRIPVNHYALDMTQCCAPDPCGKPMNSGMTLLYLAGFSSEKAIPSCIWMGALKYIAWTISNPGDEALPGINLANVNPQVSRNNAAYQSGAVEEWRLCMADAY